MQVQKTFHVPKGAKQFELEEFVREQKNERENVKGHYNEKVEEITKKLESLVGKISESRNLREDEDIEHTKMGQ